MIWYPKSLRQVLNTASLSPVVLYTSSQVAFILPPSPGLLSPSTRLTWIQRIACRLASSQYQYRCVAPACNLGPYSELGPGPDPSWSELIRADPSWSELVRADPSKGTWKKLHRLIVTPSVRWGTCLLKLCTYRPSPTCWSSGGWKLDNNIIN